MADPVTAGIMVGATLLSTQAQVSAQRRAAANARAAAAAESVRAEQAAKAVVATATFQQEEYARQAALRMSRARAVAASSGTTLPEDFFSDIADLDMKQQQLIGFYGRDKAAGILDRAAMGEWEAEAAGQVAKQQELATLIGGGASLAGIYGRYGRGSPVPTASEPGIVMT